MFFQFHQTTLYNEAHTIYTVFCNFSLCLIKFKFVTDHVNLFVQKVIYPYFLLSLKPKRFFRTFSDCAGITWMIKISRAIEAKAEHAKIIRHCEISIQCLYIHTNYVLLYF